MALDFALIELGVAVSPIHGGAESGDRHLVTDVADGVRVVVVDALGHGPEAAAAARIATDIAARYVGESMRALFERCHERLMRTRGVVMSVGTFHRDRTFTWLGVGNVAGVLVRPRPGNASHRDWLLVRSGLVGARLPDLQTTVHRLAQGDTVYIATDGVDLEAAHLDPRGPAQRVADGILHRHATGFDDALVLVARFLADGQ